MNLKNIKSNRGLKFYFYGLVFLFLSLLSINYLVVNDLIVDKKEETKFISLISKESVLVEKYVKNFFFFIETKQIQNVMAVVQEFEQNYKVLIYENPNEEDEQKRVVKKSLSSSDRKHLEEIEVKWKELKKIAISLLNVAPEKKKEGYEHILKFGDELTQNINKFVDTKNEISDQKFETIKQVQIVIIIISLIVVILTLIFINKFLIRDIYLGFSKVKEFTESIGQSSVSILENSKSVDSNSSNLASAIESTMAAITELTETTNMNRQNTKNAQSSASLSLTHCESGKTDVVNLTDSMERINSSNNSLGDQINNSNQEFHRIIDLVDQISKETLIINEIVTQTKLLSFNASVEAARAGEAGKGFAVVAKEIGELANLSGKSSKVISGLLTSSKKTIEDIISTNQEKTSSLLDSCRLRVSEGQKLANDCGKAFEEIFSNIQELSKLVQMVSNSSDEQSSGTESINNSIIKINQACQENQASSASMLQSIDSLNKDTQIFNQHIAKFSDLLLGSK